MRNRDRASLDSMRRPASLAIPSTYARIDPRTVQLVHPGVVHVVHDPDPVARNPQAFPGQLVEGESNIRQGHREASAFTAMVVVGREEPLQCSEGLSLLMTNLRHTAEPYTALNQSSKNQALMTARATSG